MRKVLLFFLILGGCQSVQEKNMSLINERVDNLSYLNRWHPTWCRIETKLTAPAIARYTQMFPAENAKLLEPVWNYTWKSQKDACEVRALTDSPLAENHKAFLNEALCVLLQVYWVNSPFSELEINADDVVRTEDFVQIRVTPKDPHLGVYLDPKSFVIETRTKTRGVLRATYGLLDGEWLPMKLEQILGKSKIVVDDIDFDSHRMNSRRMIKSFWISAGEDKPVHHSEVRVNECQNY